MNRNEALRFIRDNSRCVCSMLANPVSKSEQWEGYEPIYFEQRIGNNGNLFILQDCGKNGWDIYFNGNSNNIEKSLSRFLEETGAKLPDPVS